MSIGQKIKELRARKRESLQQVADGVGVSKAHVWDLERGVSANPAPLPVGLAAVRGIPDGR